MLHIEDLYIENGGKLILKGFSLSVQEGEVHVLMGPNGAGKSTLAKVLAGYPSYEIKSGKILFLGKDLSELAPEERAHLGLFMGFQYPVEIPGVSNAHFLHTALNAHRQAKGKSLLTEAEFEQILEEKMNKMQIKSEFAKRDVNGGFSGGEKKRNEILQMAVLEPLLAILDETDSGLDIDAMRVVAEGVKQQLDSKRSLLLITHYQRLLDYIIPDSVHVVIDGKIQKSGGPELARALEEKGYDWL